VAKPSILFNYASLKYWTKVVCLECKYDLEENIFKDYIIDALPSPQVSPKLG